MTAETPANNQLVLKPTFPLDESEIGRRALSKQVNHPVSWVTLGTCLAAGIAIQNGIWPVVLLTAAGAVGVAFYWLQRAGSVEAEVIEEMVAESNRDQDAKLSRIIDSYRRRGMPHFAAALGKFLFLKQRIEGRLYDRREGATITPTEEKVETLVDTLCGVVCHEFHKAASLDRELADVLTSRDRSRLHRLQETRTALLEAVMHDYETLHESLAALLELDTAREALASDLGTEAERPLDTANLDDVVEELREEARLARRVRDRLKADGAEKRYRDFGVFSSELDEVVEIGELLLESA